MNWDIVVQDKIKELILMEDEVEPITLRCPISASGRDTCPDIKVIEYHEQY